MTKKELAKRYREKNREKIKQAHREWYQKNKERIRLTKAANMRKYRRQNPEKYRRKWRDAKKKIRESLFAMYGNICSICGFIDKRALTLDHVKNNGNEERREMSDYMIYKRALEIYRPNEYRILCMNCQFIERQKHDSASGQKDFAGCRE